MRFWAGVIRTTVILAAFSPVWAGAMDMSHQWSKRFGDSLDDAGYSVTTDASGNVVCTGRFYGTVDFGGGPLVSAGSYDIFVVKFNSSGDHLWSKRFGDSELQEPYSVATDASGNVVITGEFFGTVDFGGGPLTSAGNKDIFVAKFNSSGNHVWSKRFGDWNIQYARAAATDASGNVVIGGYFFGAVDFGGGALTSAGSSDVFVAKFSSNGNHLWSQRFGDSNLQEEHSVATDPSGNVVVTGNFLGTMNFGGGPLTSAGGYDIFVAKFNSGGNHLWSQRFGDPAGDDYGDTVVGDASGSVVITGYFNGTVDFGGGPLASAGGYDIFVVKFDSNGIHLWSQRFGDSAMPQYAVSAATDASGNVAITGYFFGTLDFGGGPLTSAGNYDIFVAKFDSNGNHLWSQRFGDSAINQCGNSVAMDALGDVVITGGAPGTVDFGGGPLTSAGGSDIFLAKFLAQAPAGIESVRDAPGDQGGWVRMRFTRSSDDAAAVVAFPISNYGIWRRVDDPALIAVLGARSSTLSQRSATSDASESRVLPVVAYGGAVYLEHGPDLAASSFPPGTWELVLSVPAVQQETYIAAVPTVADSTASGAHYTVLVVTAHTTTPSIWWVSAPDSGCSVDNIAPGVPQNFVVVYNGAGGGELPAANGNQLTWDSCTDEDFQYFNVYRSADPDFTPDPSNRVHQTVATSWVDPVVEGYQNYKLTAVDHAGNESNPASSSEMTGVTPPNIPKIAALYPNVPNPFNPTTQIRYDVPSAGGVVTLAIYDVNGRLVKTLVNSEQTPGEKSATWDGRDDQGLRVASGVYFCRMTMGSFTNTHKAVLAK